MFKKNILIILISASFGCLQPQTEQQPVQFYDMRIAQNNLSSTAQTRVAYPSLQIGRFTALGPYAEQMVYRKSEHRLAVDELNRWIDQPAELIRIVIFEQLQTTHLFQELQVNGIGRSRLLLTGKLIRLEVSPDLKAVIELQLILSDTVRDSILLNQVYRRNVPLSQASAEAFAAAASAGVEDIVEEFVENLPEAHVPARD